MRGNTHFQIDSFGGLNWRDFTDSVVHSEVNFGLLTDFGRHKNM